MKYYKETGIPKNEYIEKYKIKNGTIICNLANGEEYILPETEENIKRIEELRIDQAKKVYALSESIIKRVKLSKLSGTILYILMLFMLTLVFLATLIEGIQFLEFISVFLIALTGNIIYISSCNNADKDCNDIEKIKIFLKENEISRLNGRVKLDINILNNISKKTKKEIEGKEGEVFTFDLIDRMSLKDLQRIKANIDRNRDFGFPNSYKVKNKVKEKKINQN